MLETETNMAAPDTAPSAHLSSMKAPVHADLLSRDDVLETKAPSRPPWKGVMVPCAKLKEYLDLLPTFNRKCMLRKGREVHKIYVEMKKGESFLDDTFAYTEFGRMVLNNGSVRAGRAKNAKQIVVARETLYCSGTGSCKRVCGGYGECIPGCDKAKMRGHRCAYRIKLTQRLGYVNFWFVEVLGDHEQLSSLSDSMTAVDSPFASSPHSSKGESPQDFAIDLSQCFKDSPERDLEALVNNSPGAIPASPSNGPSSGSQPDTSLDGQGSSDMPTKYHYVLGLMPTTTNSATVSIPEKSSTSVADVTDANTALFSSQSPSQSAIDVYRQMAANSQVMVVTPTMPVEESNGLQSYSEMKTVSPLLVKVKTEPTEGNMPGELVYTQSTSSPAPNISPKQCQGQSPQSQGQMVLEQLIRGQGQSTPVQQSPGQVSVQTQLQDLSPRQQPGEGQPEQKAIFGQVQPQATQSSRLVLGQIQSKIMERAKSRKRARTTHILPKETPSVPSNNIISTASMIVPNIPTVVTTTPSVDFSRFQTLNKILQSEAFQAAKLQLENSWTQAAVDPSLAENQAQAPAALNLSPAQVETWNQMNHNQLFEEWRKGRLLTVNQQLPVSLPNGKAVISEADKEEEKTAKEQDLICRVKQLESHVKQLQNIVIKKEEGGDSTRHGKKYKQREFDFSRYNTRHVALKVAYLGWDYHGYASQEETDKTIEAALFDALIKTKLVENRQTANYHRCGRTDKGVSAFGQVVSLDLRTNLLEGTGVKVRENGTAAERTGDKTTEVRYVNILNRTLPPEIRVLAWSPVDPNFSARFSCKKRTYKYFFPQGKLNVKSMEEAASKLVGEHDFRNLCKMDVGNVKHFVRKIVSAEIVALSESENGYAMYELTIVGLAFLWHQIRCIVSILFLVGEGKESPEVIDALLDVEKTPGKPQYNMASELPLVLFDSEFGDQLEWIYEADCHEYNIRQLQEQWAQYSIRANMVKKMLEDLDAAKVETESDIAPWADLSPPILHQSEWLIPGSKARVYKPLMDTPMGDSLEHKLAQYNKKRKLTEDTELKISTEQDNDD